MFRELLQRGIYVAPSQFEAMFLNNCFTEEELDKTIETYGEIIAMER